MHQRAACDHRRPEEIRPDCGLIGKPQRGAAAHSKERMTAGPWAAEGSAAAIVDGLTSSLRPAPPRPPEHPPPGPRPVRRLVLHPPLGRRPRPPPPPPPRPPPLPPPPPSFLPHNPMAVRW